MGNKNSGRRRLPTAVKERRGSRIRHDAKREPKYVVGLPPVPDHLRDDPIATAAWQSFGARLVASRVLTTAHAEPLALLCEAWADYVRKREEFALMGRKSVIVQTWKDSEGTTRSRVIDNPLVKQIRQQSDLVARLAGEFGLTPATASKVATLDEPETDPAEAFFNAGPPPHVVPFNRRK